MPRTSVAPDEIINFIRSGKLNSENDLPDDATKLDDVDMEQINLSRHASQRAMAVAVIKERKIIHVPEAGAWIVEGSGGNKYTVTLFPKPLCQCPSINTCYHVIAAKMSVGIEDKIEKRIINLTQIRTNSKKRQNKVAGKKKPRPVDRYDDIECIVNAAPDSDINTKHQQSKNPDIGNISAIKHSTPAELNKPKSILKKIQQQLSPPVCKKMRFDDAENDPESDDEMLHVPFVDDCESTNGDEMKPQENCDMNTTQTEESTIPYGLENSIFNNSYRDNSTQIIIVDELHFEDDEKKVSRVWINNEKVNLLVSDKFDITYNKQLTDRVINFGQVLLQKDFGENINGFQDCGYVPVQDDGDWKYALKMKAARAPVCQIHHTGANHWVTSVQPDGLEYVVLFDTLRKYPYQVTKCLEMQLMTIYGKDKKTLEVHVPNIQQQSNSVDCGVFALAYATEFCYNEIDGSERIEFSKNLLRRHLLDCFTLNKLTVFPKTVNKLSRTKKPCESEILYLSK